MDNRPMIRAVDGTIEVRSVDRYTSDNAKKCKVEVLGREVVAYRARHTQSLVECDYDGNLKVCLHGNSVGYFSSNISKERDLGIYLKVEEATHGPSVIWEEL